MKDRVYICPECAELLDALDMVQHLLKRHPSSPIAYAIRAEVDRTWVETGDRMR